jgi:hypothetical protein
MRGVTFIPIYCANCGADGGGVPEEHTTYAFYLCNPCTEKHGAPAGMLMMPDEIFFEKVKQAQLEEHGRLLSSAEIVTVLDDSSSALSKLARDAPKGR